MPLPRDETAFFGREAELSELDTRLRSGGRLVTIVGLGGIGKTRLALTVASASAKPALFVSLAGARSLDAAVREVAAAACVKLEAESRAQAALEALAAALAKRAELVLVLDNTERLGASARDLVNALLDGARELRILATAREPLGVRGEEKLVLAPLAEPEAILLLRDRARVAAGSDVELTDEQARAIVSRVDRLPLSIELAASRFDILSAAELLERLDVVADVRETLEGSWELLSDVERSALSQASIFAAPFGIDAAEEVLVLDGAEVLEVLESLVKRSLLTRSAGHDGRVRLGLLGTVRAWAREKLVDVEVRERHVRHHLAEAEHAAARTYGEGGAGALDVLEELLPELLAAFEATRSSVPETAARIVLALSDVLSFRTFFELRSELFAEGAAAAVRAGDSALVARTLVAKARVTLEDGRMLDAEQELRRALDLSTSQGDEVTWAEASRSLGWALTALGRADEAGAALHAAMAVHRKQGNARGQADASAALGIMNALRGCPDEGLAFLREALSIHVEHGDVLRQEKVLGFAALVGHEPREVARGLPREVLARAPRSSLDVLPAHVAELVRGESEAAKHWQHAIDLYQQGVAAHARRDPDAAIGLFERTIAALERTGVKRGVAAVHAHAAVAHAALGDPKEAAARLARASKAAEGDPSAELAVSVFAAAVDVHAGAPLAGAKTLLERTSRPEIGTPELAVAMKVLAAALAEGGPASPAATPALLVGEESRWIVPPRGERVDLVRYGPVRRLLERLVVARLEEPGIALSAEALIEAGWPGERMRHSAGLLRVYSAVRRLRRLGLDVVLVTRDDGYLLDPDAPVGRAPGAG
jgi:predicted ATPase